MDSYLVDGANFRYVLHHLSSLTRLGRGVLGPTQTSPLPKTINFPRGVTATKLSSHQVSGTPCNFAPTGPQGPWRAPNEPAEGQDRM